MNSVVEQIRTLENPDAKNSEAGENRSHVDDDPSLAAVTHTDVDDTKCSEATEHSNLPKVASGAQALVVSKSVLDVGLSANPVDEASDFGLSSKPVDEVP